MADNYTHCTVNPYLPKSWFTDKDVENLEAHGFVLTQEDKKGHYYIFSENMCPPFDEEGNELADCPEWDNIFQDILKRKNSNIQIIVEGSYTCSRMRMDEFGGFCALITKDHILNGSTGGLIHQFRAKIAAKKKRSKKKRSSN